MNYYSELKKNLKKCEIYDKSKDYSKNTNKEIISEKIMNN